MIVALGGFGTVRSPKANWYRTFFPRTGAACAANVSGLPERWIQLAAAPIPWIVIAPGLGLVTGGSRYSGCLLVEVVAVVLGRREPAAVVRTGHAVVELDADLAAEAGREPRDLEDRPARHVERADGELRVGRHDHRPVDAAEALRVVA